MTTTNMKLNDVFEQFNGYYGIAKVPILGIEPRMFDSYFFLIKKCDEFNDLAKVYSIDGKYSSFDPNPTVTVTETPMIKTDFNNIVKGW